MSPLCQGQLATLFHLGTVPHSSKILDRSLTFAVRPGGRGAAQPVHYELVVGPLTKVVARHLGPTVRGNDGEIAAILSTDRVQGVRGLSRTGGRPECVCDDVRRGHPGSRKNPCRP